MFRDLNILITGVGAPGIQGTLYSVRNNYDKRKVKVTGTDISKDAVGRFLCDSFHLLPPARSSEVYLSELKRIVKDEKIDVILPQNTSELSILSKSMRDFNDLGAKILVSGNESIEIANDKYKLLNIVKRAGIPVCNYALVSNFSELKSVAIEFGWPGKNVVVKPPVSNGSRGMRVVSEKVDKKKEFFENKPSGVFVTMNELEDILDDNFPDLIIMDFLPGDEYTVDIFRVPMNFVAIPRKRSIIKNGITFGAIAEKNDEIIRYSKQISDILNLTYCFGLQFKYDERNRPVILESNPRIQGTMVMSSFCNANLIYSAVKALLNEEIPPFDIDWTTELLRYWGAVAKNKDGIVRI